MAPMGDAAAAALGAAAVAPAPAAALAPTVAVASGSVAATDTTSYATSADAAAHVERGDALRRAKLVADDGEEVDALGGAPGVRSARYAADEGTGVEADAAANVARLLRDLDGFADGRRTARFRTVALVRWPDGGEAVATGTVEGRIATGPSGDGGFGYDPVFVPLEGDGRTFAEMGNEKHAISHRGRAFRDLARRLSSG